MITFLGGGGIRFPLILMTFFILILLEIILKLYGIKLITNILFGLELVEWEAELRESREVVE